jgi:hypothetical protein
MKTTKLVLLAIVCFIFGFGIYLHAQSPAEQTGRYIERSINGQTYIYDTQTRWIQNKKNYIEKIEEQVYCEHFGVNEIKSYHYIFDELFSEERKKEMKEMSLPMVFYCDDSGRFLEVAFNLKDISMFTLEEVYALENAFLKHRVEIVNDCPDKKYYLLMAGYRFK